MNECCVCVYLCICTYITYIEYIYLIYIGIQYLDSFAWYPDFVKLGYQNLHTSFYEYVENVRYCLN